MTRLLLSPTLSALAGAAAVAVACAWCSGPEPLPPITRSDVLRSELLVEQLQERGYVVTTAAAHEDLTRDLQELRDSTDAIARERARLAREVETLGGRVQAATTLAAEAKAELALRGEVFPTHENAPANSPPPDSIRWLFADSTFDVRATYTPPDSLELSLSARIRASLAVIETPDRRLLFTAVSSDPRVSLQLSDAAYQLPDPVRAECRFWCAAKFRLQGAAAALVVDRAIGFLRR